MGDGFSHIEASRSVQAREEELRSQSSRFVQPPILEGGHESFGRVAALDCFAAGLARDSGLNISAREALNPQP